MTSAVAMVARSRNVFIQSGQYRAADLEDEEHKPEAKEEQKYRCSEQGDWSEDWQL
jgi:hypothetical protein